MFEFLEVISPGCGASWQDAGRPGFKRFGVPPGGWMDPVAATEANRLAGNDAAAVVLELALQGARFRALRDGWLGISGASMGLPTGVARRVARGEEMNFTRHEGGVYAYLAAPGGWVAPKILGSSAVSARCGLGRSLAAGDALCCHHDPSRPGWQPPMGREGAVYAETIELPVWRGPQWNEFSAGAQAGFLAAPWTITARSDRMGVRLQGAAIVGPTASMPSEPVRPGSVQVTGGGQPVVTMRDGPTVGGYPKIGWIDADGCRRLAQVPPGGTVKFFLHSQ